VFLFDAIQQYASAVRIFEQAQEAFAAGKLALQEACSVARSALVSAGLREDAVPTALRAIGAAKMPVDWDRVHDIFNLEPVLDCPQMKSSDADAEAPVAPPPPELEPMSLPIDPRVTEAFDAASIELGGFVYFKDGYNRIRPGLVMDIVQQADGTRRLTIAFVLRDRPNKEPYVQQCYNVRRYTECNAADTSVELAKEGRAFCWYLPCGKPAPKFDPGDTLLDAMESGEKLDFHGCY
jgi:hypothetical protein